MTKARAVGGPVLTRSFLVLVALAALAGITIVWRFAAGLGATTALNDGYPWGLWIAFDVVTGTALACGGYAMALLVYIFNKGKYHPLVRPAILTSALGYSIAGFSVVIDIGRPWMAWKLPLFINHWNLNSALLEVALCIMAYSVVLYLELTRRRSPQGDRLLLQKVTACPECRKTFLGLAGEIGLTAVPPAVEGVET